MAEVLLTHSYHLRHDRKQVRKMQPYPPLATLYAAAFLRSQGISVAVHDTMLADTDELTSALRTHTPRIVVVYDDDFNFLTKMCLSKMRDVALGFARQARHAGALVVGHGSDATDHAMTYLSSGFDAILFGESERTLHELCSRALRGADWSDTTGIIRMHNGQMISNPAQPSSKQVDEIPEPARDLIDLEPYRRAWKSHHGYFSLNMVSSRGCPFQCNWCAKPIFGDHFALRSPALVASELMRLKNLYGAEHIWFADDIFAINRHWIRDFAQEIERLGCAVPFKIQTRAELLTGPTVEALKRAGCDEVWMGVESGSQAVLDAMDKGLTPYDVIKARKFLGAAGIRAGYFLQFGYPGEGWHELKQTIELVRNTRPDEIGVSFSYPLPNTRFHANVSEQIGRKRNWVDSDDLCVIFKGAYTDAFYRAVRDALHCEVDSWSGRSRVADVNQRWEAVDHLEPMSRNSDPTEITSAQVKNFVPIQQLQDYRKEA